MTLPTEFAMQSTEDWAEEMSTQFETETNSTEDMMTLRVPMRRGARAASTNFLAYVLIVGGVMAQ